MESISDGSLEVICGPMFSGKTEEMIRRLRRLFFAKKSVLVFKPEIDTRYDDKKVMSHNGLEVDAIPISDPFQILDEFKSKTGINTIAIDEVQFLDSGNSIESVINTLIKRGVHVIITGLDTDFRGEPFGCMPRLMAIADKVTKLDAICTVCGQPACRTQRIVNGKPANYDDPIVVVGATEMYEARCRKHHEILGKD